MCGQIVGSLVPSGEGRDIQIYVLICVAKKRRKKKLLPKAPPEGIPRNLKNTKVSLFFVDYVLSMLFSQDETSSPPPTKKKNTRRKRKRNPKECVTSDQKWIGSKTKSPGTCYFTHLPLKWNSGSECLLVVVELSSSCFPAKT